MERIIKSTSSMIRYIMFHEKIKKFLDIYL